MNDKIIMGYWDCQYCNTKGIEGTKRECSSCGRARGEGVKFYMDKSNIRYLTPAESKNKGKGPDWLCSFCSSLNSTLEDSCISCGASKKDSEKNYFEIHNIYESESMARDFKKISVSDDEFKSVAEAKTASKSSVSNKKTSFDILGSTKRFFSRFGIPILGIVALICLIIAIIPKTKEFTPKNFSWIYNIDIESYETVEESDWLLPANARLCHTEEEIHHYDKVIDHYETKTRTYTEQVSDGYDISYTYSDNGDGTFTQKEVKTPKYRTEYRTEQYEDPVYKDVPVYQTKYYYEIDKWVYKRSVTTNGGDKNPYWGNIILANNEREGSHHETYYVTGIADDKAVTYTCSKAIWDQLSKGITYKIKVSLNTIIEVE